ncbi:ribonuclease D [Neolewinella antarctica]|uniref:Ribonuclease D n=1 Tax=Neolewinella antarctica TaxID=442734 RepID=A0ABX0X7Y4_9BACT|nr:ribonuclease D [Neolewinella antarctica]NJC25094.1 ribonuclease D [Neolewinella antarctica]
MPEAQVPYTYVQTPQELDKFAADNRGINWMGFDTEFIGEKRYYTLLCLIQVSTDHGYYLIDPIAVENIDPFLAMLEDESIVKITHAGDNDYRLLYINYGTVPKNLFDTQLSAGFIGHRFPMSFAKLVEAEVGEQLGKGYAVTDWAQRPMTPKQIKYALNDVIYLRLLYDTITEKLRQNGREPWALEECNLMGDPAYYYRDPNHEFLNSNVARSARTKERVFLLRVYEWRRATAEKKNYSKDMILQSKIISQLARGVKGGKESMASNRRLPGRTVDRYGDMFVDMYTKPATEEELEVANSVNRLAQEDEEDDMIIELLYLIMKYRANENEISHSLVMPRNTIRKMKQDKAVRQSILGSGWRRELLGDDFVNWIKNFESLSVRLEGSKIVLES